jgi:hypothetical protein
VRARGANGARLAGITHVVDPRLSSRLCASRGGPWRGTAGDELTPDRLRSVSRRHVPLPARAFSRSDYGLATPRASARTPSAERATDDDVLRATAGVAGPDRAPRHRDTGRSIEGAGQCAARHRFLLLDFVALQGRAAVGEQHGSTQRAVEAGPGFILSSLAFQSVKAAEVAAELVHRVHHERLAG